MRWRAFWRGFLSGLDLTGAFPSTPRRLLRRPVAEAFADDWRAVGNDLRKALHQLKHGRDDDPA